LSCRPPRTGLLEASKDYRLLLTMGYPYDASLDLVGSKHLLSREERLLLFRCVHSEDFALGIASRIKTEGVNEIVLDFYNVLITVLSILSGDCVYLCDDCIVRDLRGSKIRRSDEQNIPRAIEHIVAESIEHGLRKVIVVADKAVSHSAEHVQLFRATAESRGIVAESILSDTADSTIVKTAKECPHCAVATTDGVILSLIDNAVFPLTTLLSKRLSARICFCFTFGWRCGAFSPMCTSGSAVYEMPSCVND